MTEDVFGTAALRRSVLQTWSSQPSRLREDANLEEDFARGYYRERVLIELAQNAADAAALAGLPGRLLLRLDGDTLIAANTGAELTAAGVASMASLRASAKSRGEATAAGLVGRFGVGFAAVRSVADQVRVLSAAGGVGFSLDLTRRALDDLVAGGADGDHRDLAAEVAARGDRLPVLRLPFPDDGGPPEGWTTAVLLRLRDAEARAAVLAELTALDDTLLLALPALAEVVVDTGAARVLRDVTQRWLIARAQGGLPAELLADRPVEERAKDTWQVTWAVPRPAAPHPADSAGPGGRLPGVVLAPTPTEEPCTVPAVLIATLPLDPTRRHVAPGPLADAVLGHAADLYAELATLVQADGGDPLTLVPVALPAGAVDGALHERLVARLAGTPLLRPAAAPVGGGPGSPSDDVGSPVRLLTAREAVTVSGVVGRDPEVVAALGAWFPALVHVDQANAAQARVLGVAARELGDLVDELPPAPADDLSVWLRLYDALLPHAADVLLREQLAQLPVPLVGGGMRRGVRGLVVGAGSDGDPAPAALAALRDSGVQVAAVTHPLLDRLGALALTSRMMLDLPQLREAVDAAVEADDADQADDALMALDPAPTVRQAVEAVLAVVRAALVEDGRLLDPPSWLATLPLPVAPPVTEEPGADSLAGQGADAEGSDGEGSDGEVWAEADLAPAGETVLPGGPAARLLDPELLPPVHPVVVADWGTEVLAAVGARDGLRVEAVVADDGAAGLPDAVDYLDTVDDADDLLGVADLDAVLPQAWPEAISTIASDRDLRGVLLPSTAGTPSYTAWWLRRRAGLGLDRPFAIPAGRPVPFLPGPPQALAGTADEAVLRALGGMASLADLDEDGWAGLFDGLPGVGTAVDPRQARELWWALAGAAGAGLVVDPPPQRLVALVGPGLAAVVPADSAAVAGEPMWWPLAGSAAPLLPCRTGPRGGEPDAAAEGVAAMLDLPLVEEILPGQVHAVVTATHPVPQALADELGLTVTRWQQCAELTIDGVAVPWWVDGSGADAVVWATDAAGAARAVAQADRRWRLRHLLGALLTGPAPAELVEHAWDPPEG